MTHLEPLIARNAQIALDHQPVPLAPPTSQTVILSCLDHRLPPESFLGLERGEAMVIRNAGGRVTPSVIADVAFLDHLAQQVFAGPDADFVFEVAVIHHEQCGTGFLADESFRQGAAQSTGIRQDVFAAMVVVDPIESVREDVARLLQAPEISPKVTVSGHVYDLETGRITTVIDAAVRTPGS